MFSMTGFGKGEVREGGIELTCELKTVNNRFLDVSLKCPHIFSPYEDKIRAILREHLSRGRVDVYISYTDKRERAKSLYVDVAAAKAYLEAAQTLANETGLTSDITVSYLMRAGDIVRQEEQSCVDEELLAALEEAVSKAAVALKAMREKEGERLKQDLLSRVKTIEVLHGKIKERAPLVAEEYRKKLTDRINEYLGGKVDESRILTEAAIFADKCNIDEELTRLTSHITEFYHICESEAVGRKLDFLVQEFNRECNTVCSKSNDASLTSYALDMKNEIEKIREQIQNLE